MNAFLSSEAVRRFEVPAAVETSGVGLTIGSGGVPLLPGEMCDVEKSPLPPSWIGAEERDTVDCAADAEDEDGLADWEPSLVFPTMDS